MTIPYKKILVTLDGSALAEAALPHAQALAQQSGAELIVLRVVPHITDELVAVDMLPLEFTSLEVQQQKMIDEATLALKNITATLTAQNIPTQPVVVVGHTAEKIVDYAIAHAVDLIVMSTHGRTGVQRWLLGSVAGKVSAASPCPLLLVRAG